MSVLIVTPLEKELRALKTSWTVAGYEARSGDLRVPSFEISTLKVICAAAGHGKTQFAIATQHLLDTSEPFEAVVVAGAAGALSDTLRPGDVVVGTESVEHDYKTRFHGVGQPPRHPTAPDLVEAIRKAQPEWTDFRVHAGPIAGGDEDIVDSDRARELRESTGAICVAWEGPGGARAAAFSGVPFVEVRATTDRSDDSAAVSYRSHLTEALSNVGKVILAWLSNRNP